MLLEKNKPHQEYKLADGTLVPGVTTILGVLDKPGLAKWRWQCGKDGIPWPIPKDATAGVGTISHYKIACWLKDEVPEFGPGWKEEHIKMANAPLTSFIEYYHKRKAQLLHSEIPLVSEVYRYGGTTDLLVDTDTGLELWDVKTSKRLYEENYVQLSGYKILVRENLRTYHKTPIRCRAVLCAKDGKLDAPSVCRDYMEKATQAWLALVPLYHRLTRFRKVNYGNDRSTTASNPCS
jgi:PD-(D/E)XK nuclease superfamily protein